MGIEICLELDKLIWEMNDGAGRLKVVCWRIHKVPGNYNMVISSVA